MFLTNTFPYAIISATVAIHIKIYLSHEYFVASSRSPYCEGPLSSCRKNNDSLHDRIKDQVKSWV